MRQVKISDVTMKQAGKQFTLSFREKIELAKLLDALGVSVIELEGVGESRTDALRVKSVAQAVQNSTVAVPVQLDEANITAVWNALKTARHPRLQVCAPVSSVQMEYLYHKKAEAMLEDIKQSVTLCRALCADVEFVADDATRADEQFLAGVLTAAIEAGAATVTVCDSAGTMLPGEFSSFVSRLYQTVPALSGVTLGVNCSNALSLADACAIAAVGAGAGEVKAAAYAQSTASVASVAEILAARGDSLQAASSVRTAQLSRIVGQITWMCQTEKKKTSPFDSGVRDDEGIYLSAHDEADDLLKAVAKLGYDLSEEDGAKVVEAFRAIAAKKEQVGIRELDAIVASAAMQVPAAYRLDTYVINSGNTIASSAHMRLIKDEQVLEGVCLGDGPIDAAFLAIEQITGRHYELDDFQLQAVTEGREAMGQTIVRLRSGGKLYSGRGISTDIVCAGINAYLSALNKIVYEEESV
ncbi:MAG: hypothetical protein IJB75_03590 [Oscillospiraceae bacterium]|nr:hypothetical protein [Oscillospiraceae bacterium]